VTRPSFLVLISVAGVFASSSVFSYEINNHADMSQVSAQKSSLSTDVGSGVNGKLARLGLKQYPVTDPRQTFPLLTPILDKEIVGVPASGTQPAVRARPATPLEYCFGQYTDPDGIVTQDSFSTQPNWAADRNSGYTEMSIAQAIRCGAVCWGMNTSDRLP
jgi:hypothetical protein